MQNTHSNLKEKAMRGILCAAVMLWASVSQAVEITFDGSNQAAWSDLTPAGNYIDVGRFRWSDFALSNQANTAPAPAVDDSGWTLNRITNDQAEVQTGTNTSGTGGSQSYTLSTTITKLAGGRQIGSIGVGSGATLGTNWTYSASVSGLSGSLGSIASDDNNRLNALNNRIFFAPQDYITVTQNITADNSQLDFHRIDVWPVAMVGTSVDVTAGKYVNDAVLGGTQVVGGIDIQLWNVVTDGTFSATPTIVQTSMLSQAILDQLPYDPGDTFTSYEFDYTGELAFDSFNPGIIASFVVKYDPEALGIPASLIRVFHKKDNGEYQIIIPAVNEELGLISFGAESFSSFSLGQLILPEPSSGWLLLLGIPILRKKRKWQANPDHS